MRLTQLIPVAKPEQSVSFCALWNRVRTFRHAHPVAYNVHLTSSIFEASTWFGYVDGGTGSLLLQAALAGAFAAAYSLKGAFAKLVATIKKSSRTPSV